MNEILNWSIGALALLLVIYIAADAFSSMMAVLIESSVRWIQRVLFGISQPRAGSESLLGRQVIVHSVFVHERESEKREGFVVVNGELWRARPVCKTEYFVPGERLCVAGREGLVLLVHRSKSQPKRVRAA